MVSGGANAENAGTPAGRLPRRSCTVIPRTSRKHLRISHVVHARSQRERHVIALTLGLADTAGLSTERNSVLAQTFRISAWVTLLAAVPPCIAMALLGDHRRALIIFGQEICMLAALWLNRSGRLEWAAGVAALGVLASAMLMVGGSADGFHDVGLLILPGVLFAAALADLRFYVAFAGFTLVAATGAAARTATRQRSGARPPS